ncbi:MAG: hypothetical protein LJF30_23650 [Acidobacteria bacterium]|jgi:hypothetical protein|nr:hypothetical protein [Acidobacteriota bacterium]
MRDDTQEIESTPPVAIFDADWPPALVFARSLSRAGVPVHVYSHRRFPAARLCRDTVAFARCPNPSDLESFQGWLDAELGSGRIELVAPTSDLVLCHLHLLGRRHPPLVAASIAPTEALLSALVKDRFAQRCQEAGVRTPRVMTPRSADEARAAGRVLGFPVVVKPRAHFATQDRGRLVRDEASLAKRFVNLMLETRDDVLLDRLPDLRWPLVQEYIPHGPGDLLSVAGVLSPEGRVLGASASRKWAQWPPRLGVGTFFEDADDPDLVARGCDLARRLLGRGFFEIEYVRDRRTGELFALDLNPRAYGQIELDAARGLDLPWIWYRSVTGRPLEALSPPLVRGMAWLQTLPFVMGLLFGAHTAGGRREGRQRLSMVLRRQRVHAGLNRHDLASSGLYLLRTAGLTLDCLRGYLRPGA